MLTALVGEASMRSGVLVLTIGILGCSDRPVDPFAPVPECKGVDVTPFQGSRSLVVATLAIADFGEGFDLNRDGKKDNKLAPLGAVANPTIADSFSKKHDIVLPLELYGYNGEASTSCTKLSFYIGKFNQDVDHDGKDTTWDTNDDGTARGDCMDAVGYENVNPGAPEVAGNRLDDDCDGYADNATRGKAPEDNQDLDGDGYTLKMGDCDDRADTPEHKAMAALRHPGAPEICGDGIDQNCDGIPDNTDACDPFQQNDMTMRIDPIGLDATTMAPLIQFKDGAVKKNVLSAGPDLFSLSVPFQAGSSISLELKGARVNMTLADAGGLTNVTNGLLGGVLEAVSLAQIKNINAGGVIKPDQTLLDAVFVGAAAPILGLDTDHDGHFLPDIDVDGDGLETFWQENPVPGQSARVDICKDGDGTIVRGLDCPLAKDKHGKYRFVDGLSVAIKFTAVPAKLGAVITK
jgi:hypothetical protein